MTSIRKIKKRLKAIRPRTYTASCWVKLPNENWKVITYTVSMLNPKQVVFPVPDNAMVTCMTLERGDTTAKWNALNAAHGIKGDA
jgi:hypothetical protein